MQRITLSVAERQWLVAHADVPDPLRIDLIAMALRTDDTVELIVGRQGMDALDAVFLRSDVYHAKLADGLLLATLALKVWAALLRERVDEIAPLWREGWNGNARDDNDHAYADESAERAPAG